MSISSLQTKDNLQPINQPAGKQNEETMDTLIAEADAIVEDEDAIRKEMADKNLRMLTPAQSQERAATEKRTNMTKSEIRAAYKKKLAQMQTDRSPMSVAERKAQPRGVPRMTQATVNRLQKMGVSSAKQSSAIDNPKQLEQVQAMLSTNRNLAGPSPI